MLVTLHLSTTSCRAQEIVFSDDFSTDLSKWQPIRDNGRFWSIEDGRAKVSIPYHFTITELVPKDEYWNASWHDLEYSFTMTPTRGVDRNASFNVRSIRNWFEIHLLNTFFNVVSIRDGSSKLDAYHPLEMRNGETYHIKIRFVKGTTTVFIDEAQLSQDTDNSFVDQYGKIGLKGSTGSVAPTVVYFDDVQVTLIDASTPAAVPLYKQTDPLWADTTYDHATSWDSEPTIARWGCALTSLAMIMKAYQLNQLPNGEAVTPLSLNTWLSTQPDGYLFQGWLNWVAATRLTQLISQRYGTPVLEYASIREHAWESAQEQLTKERPVILEIEGHFMVGTGETTNQQDLLINDPFYPYQSFSEHHQSLLSTRTFTPSHTDLSYVLIIVPKGVSVTLMYQGQQLTLEPETTLLRGAGTKRRTHPVTVFSWAKPNSGEYQLQFTSSSVQNAQVTVHTYQQDGQVTTHQLSAHLGIIPYSYQLIYDKSQPSTITKKPSNFDVVSPLLYWLRGYVHRRYFDQITALEHQFAEVRYLTEDVQATTVLAIRTSLEEILKQQHPWLQDYVLGLLPVP